MIDDSFGQILVFNTSITSRVLALLEPYMGISNCPNFFTSRSNVSNMDLEFIGTVEMCNIILYIKSNLVLTFICIVMAINILEQIFLCSCSLHGKVNLLRLLSWFYEFWLNSQMQIIAFLDFKLIRSNFRWKINFFIEGGWETLSGCQFVSSTDDLNLVSNLQGWI